MPGKMIIVSAPSGAGKTTIVKYITDNIPSLGFSVSATSRPPRKGETDGKDYYFLSASGFKDGIERGDFVEWEEVYHGHYYGTLKSEVERIWADGMNIIFDVDVKGGIALKRLYADKALSLFIMPPNIEELEKRLRLRGKESEEKIRMRVDKAAEEIGYAGRFDEIIINDDLATAQMKALEIIENFLNWNGQ
ncbi:MAG: guanylate kinase [Bacteroidales bacterium]|nr:guanylate kinase [Bacteroidales bacterium]